MWLAWTTPTVDMPWDRALSMARSSPNFAATNPNVQLPVTSAEAPVSESTEGFSAGSTSPS